ncbi:MAG: cyclic nucleotide-binding domain-containing protein [Nitrospira sp.]|nr:cyclic nucleotide-binding domain-containing protein [Nitrospira sp.]
MALLTCSPRNSSVVTKTDCTLYKLLKSDFEEIVQMDSTFSNILNEKYKDNTQYNNLKTLQPFAMLEPEKMLTLTEKLKEKKYSAGEDIIKQGEDGDAYYIVKSGSLAVIKQKGDEEPVQVATLTTGHAFGEESLIREEPRNATVRAIEETTVLRLEKKDFEEILQSAYLAWDFPEEVEEKRDDYFLIDARIPPEYEEEHIKGAVNIPIEILRQKYSALDPSITYRTYCLNDSRGMTAAFLMKSQGFKVQAIKGGLSGWDGQVVQGGNGIHTPKNQA